MAVKSLSRCLLLGISLALSSPLLAQQLFNYTENHGSGNRIALGYPVPIPQNSATPFDGFRSYDGLHARHQDLMLQHDFIQGEIVGQTIAGREIWAYVLGDTDLITAHAGAESSALINGGIHAREWASPELTTGLIEAWADNAGDRYLYDYLIDNVHFTVLPVNNVDGFLQTQRYPTEVLIGRDPSFSQWPRDGRMRRKNMRSTDEFLFTLDDHLRGIDLNRNNSPFWATTSSSSSDPNNLTFHGSAPFSEPEAQALLAAAELAQDERLRWYQDSHSFSQVFFSKRTFNQRRNQIQGRLLASYSQFYNTLSIQRNGQSRRYADRPDSGGGGIGVTADYFAYTYEIPSWTLEIEPLNGGEDYGGFGANHDGFVLPESEVRRMRNDMATTHAVVAYKQAGPPSIQSLQILDMQDRMVFSSSWSYASGSQRTRTQNQREPLLPGYEYRLFVKFDKPMRWLSETGPALAPGHGNVPFEPDIDVRSENTSNTLFSINTQVGQWLDEYILTTSPSNYRFDTFEVVFTVPDEVDVSDRDGLTLSVSAQDFTGQALDANPGTVVDWSNGAWNQYENSEGQSGDTGGRDDSADIVISPQDRIRAWLLRRR